MRYRIYAGLCVVFLLVLMTVIYRTLDEMGWQFALGALFAAAIYQLGYYCKTGTHYGP
jgi:hypothetical protein